MTLENKKILLTGGGGFLGTHIAEKLVKKGVPRKNILIPRQSKYDLRKFKDCKKAVSDCQIIIHLAAKVGGIGFNQEKPGELFYDNIIMGAQIIEAARLANAEKVVILGTICSYPKFTPVPFKEDDLWNGYPEETNAPYGLAKKALLIQAQAYNKEYGMNIICPFLVNLYGPNDNFDSNRSHVIPAMIKKVYDAKKAKSSFVEFWGTGRPTREFIYVEDAAEGIIKATEQYDEPSPINLGSGMEISIKKLGELICNLMNYRGEIRWDISQPDGQPRRVLDVSKARKEFNFEARTPFKKGLKITIDWYLKYISKKQMKI